MLRKNAAANSKFIALNGSVQTRYLVDKHAISSKTDEQNSNHERTCDEKSDRGRAHQRRIFTEMFLG